MVYNKNYDKEGDEDALAYDLRQIYAKDLVGETLKQIRIARVTENYILWYHLLKRDLFTEIYQKLDEDEVKVIEELITQVKKILVANSGAYLKTSKNENEHEAVEDALCKLERKMRRIMDKEHNMFGLKDFEDEGL